MGHTLLRKPRPNDYDFTFHPEHESAERVADEYTKESMELYYDPPA